MRLVLIKGFVSGVLALATAFAASVLTGGVRIIALLILGGLLLFLIGKRKYVILYVFGFVSGPLAEAIGIYFHQWAYSNTWILGFPFWLPFVWGNAALYLGSLKQFIDEIYPTTS
jgi:hypothetical protein